MKQLETKTVAVGDNTFYIRPFPAFKAANISGQLATMITPMIGGLLPLAKCVGNQSQNRLFDINIEDAAPAIAGAFSSLSGDRLEELLKQLLIVSQNISMDDPETGKAVRLTEEVANEVFCGDTQDMFLLATEVIKLNFNGFFEKLGSQFGSAFVAMKAAMVPSTPSTGA